MSARALKLLVLGGGASSLEILSTQNAFLSTEGFEPHNNPRDRAVFISVDDQKWRICQQYSGRTDEVIAENHARNTQAIWDAVNSALDRRHKHPQADEDPDLITLDLSEWAYSINAVPPK